MRIALRHFLRPARSLGVIRHRLAHRAELRQLIRQGRERFAGDPRYRMESVEKGFAARPSSDADGDVEDHALLERICAAYGKAIERQQSASETYQANRWWRLVQGGRLEPVIGALAARDIRSLRAMYRNFFRDACGGGLTGLPGILSSREYKELFLIDALHRVDLWTERTAGRFPLADLATPEIGNPFGAIIDGVLVRTGCEDQHFYAQQILTLAQPAELPATVAEIGGGFGGMAYFLIRDCPGIRYLNFDVPESIALASWYLLKSFPDLKATLYGEAELHAETLRTSDIILMPAFTFPRLPDQSVDVSFNSHVLSDLPARSVHEYLAGIVRTTRKSILHVNGAEACRTVSEYLAATDFALLRSESVAWNRARSLRPDDVECLYSTEPVA